MSAQPLNLYKVTKYTSSKRGQLIAGHAGNEKQVSYTFDVDDGPIVSDTDKSVQIIPAGALILSCEAFVEKTLSGGTNFTVGLAEPDGSTIDNDGLITSESATTGAVVGEGALIGTSLSADAQLKFGGNRIAGVLTVVVTYKTA